MQNIMQWDDKNIYIYLYMKYLCCLKTFVRLDALLWNLVKWGYLCLEHPDLVPPTTFPGFLIEILGKPIVILAKFSSNCHKA